MKITTKAILSSLIVLALLATTGCNTVKGIGEDLEAAGRSIQESRN